MISQAIGLLAAAVSLLGTAPLPNFDSVSLDSPQFIDEHGAATPLSPGTVLTAGLPGQLRCEFDFHSPLYDEVGARYRFRTITAFWRFVIDGTPLTHDPEGQWLGSKAMIMATVLSFDPATGNGRASLSIPLGAIFSGAYDTPTLPAGDNSVSIAAGWLGLLGIDGTGEPTTVLWSGSTTVAASWPETRLDVTVPVSAVGDTVRCFVVLSAPATSTRTITISSTVPDLIDIETPILTIEPTILAHEFSFVAKQIGRFSLIATEAGAEMARSRDCGATAPRLTSMAQTIGGGWTCGGSDHPAGPPIVETNWGECTHAACHPEEQSYFHCGECVIGTPQVSCPEYAVLLIPGSCSWDLLEFCIVNPNGPAHLDCPLFHLENIETVECGVEISVQGSVSAKVKKIGGEVGVGVTFKKHKRCCDYRRVSGATADTTANDCYP